MAALANTKLTTTSVGNREELSDVVNRITPEDTPVYTAIGTDSCVSVHPEWEIDELAPPEDNHHPEGDEYGFDGVDSPQRVGNYTQIMRKSFIISNTQETVDEAGRIQKTKRQKLKKGIEIKKDVEYGILANKPSVAGADRQSAGMAAWIESNANRGSGGANGGFDVNSGLVVAATNGTQRAFTQAIMDDVMSQGYTAGANYSMVSVSPYVKSVFVSFMSNADVAPFRYSVSDGNRNSIISNADIYEGPYGKVMIKPNRVQVDYTSAGGQNLSRNALFVDPDMAEWLWLRKIQEDRDVAKTGDAKKTVIIGEGTLKVANEAGLGVAADIFGMSATT
ncbi:hypothetical protein GCM10007989_07430 [Devosia pacifica]|uniref:Head protein n=1 Tax=Devosia pacifica TaxID=1335967 RepID=A0A918RY15_9HYPH|nr:DUF5309 domain-containing protein [Devosia pacifica]GHA15187.1 hypothetical protein GCM10007989_07430 [Devosia pacifica]